MPRYPLVGATLIERLARGVTCRGEGLGEHILFDALNRALQLSRGIASAAVVVEAKDVNAERFYARYSFMLQLHASRTARQKTLPANGHHRRHVPEILNFR